MNKSQQGVTLIESLVALMVLSIGLLGTAHLMATGIKQSNSSFHRTQATYIAENIAERMRANPEAVTAMDYAAFDSGSLSCTSAIPTCGSTATTSCSAKDLADYDLYQASCGQGGSTNGDNGVKAVLPGGSLTIACNGVCAADSTYTISVNWTEVELQSDNTDGQTTKSVQHVILP